MIKALKNQKGMTLVELLAVMVIIGIIAAISIPAIGNLLENSRLDAHVSNAVNLQESARLFAVANEVELAQAGEVTLSQTAAGWTAKFGSGGTAAASDFDSYITNLKDPHSKENYGTATVKVTYTPTNGKMSYEVLLKGSKVGMETAQDATTLTRSSFTAANKFTTNTK